MLWECTLRLYRVLRFYQHKTYNYNTCSLYKLMPLLYNLSCYIWVVIVIRCTSCIALSCCEDLFQGFCPGFLSRELQKTVSFMGDLYWSSLANRFMGYYWFNLLKRNRFWRGVTVLWPKCYTLEAKLWTIDIAYKYSTIMGTGIVHPSLTHFKLLCSFYRYQYTSLAIQYSIAKQQTFNILNMHLSLDELRCQIWLERHPSDFSCVLGIQYDQLVFQFLVSNFVQMIHGLLKFLYNWQK